MNATIDDKGLSDFNQYRSYLKLLEYVSTSS